MPKARVSKIVIIAALLAGFYFFGETLRPLQSSLQHEFDTWLSGEQEHLKSAVRFAADKAETEASGTKTSASAANLPTLEVRIRQPDTELEEVYRVVPNSDPSRPQQLLRLLDLMKEAGVFDANRGAGIQSSTEAILHFKVEGPDRNFETSLKASDVEGSISSLLLLKLFKEFSKVQAPVPQASSMGQASSSAALESSSAALSSEESSVDTVTESSTQSSGGEPLQGDQGLPTP